MKNIILGIVALIVLMMPISCSEQLDINTNPLAATKADPNAVLPFVIVTYSNRRVTELGTRMVDVYHHSHFTFNSPKNGGGAAGGFISSNYWGMLYTNAMPNLSLVERDAKATGVTNNNVAAIAIILKAMAFFDATCIWGDVPFTEALQADQFKFPKFDSQQTVLNGVIGLLDEAVALIDAMPASGVANVTQGDLVYGGNMTNWKRFANSLKIRTLMLLRNKDTSADAKLVTALAQPYIVSDATDSQAAMLRYSSSPGNQNAWLQIVTAFGTGSNVTTNYFAPGPVMRPLLDGDPRLQLWCVDGTLGGYQVRAMNLQPNASFARYSDNVIRATLPDIWLLPSEITFYRAELAAKGVISGDVNTLFRQGVTETLKFYGQTIPGAAITLTTTQITNFVNGLPDLSTLPTAQQLQRIGEQQYLETFLRPIEAWNHVRRTKIPAVPASPGSTITTMLKRFLHSSVERAANPNTPVDVLTDVPMWFEN